MLVQAPACHDAKTVGLRLHSSNFDRSKMAASYLVLCSFILLVAYIEEACFGFNSFQPTRPKQKIDPASDPKQQFESAITRSYHKVALRMSPERLVNEPGRRFGVNRESIRFDLGPI